VPIEKWQLFLSKLFAIGLYAFPASAIIVVGLALYWGGRTGTLRAAQVYGGPTEDAQELALRVRALALDDAGEVGPLEGVIELCARLADGSESRAKASLSKGLAEAIVKLDHAISGPVSLTVLSSDTGAELAKGTIELRASEWNHSAQQRGGWREPVERGALALRVAVESGVLAVPFEGALLIRVEDQSPAAVQIEIKAEGAEILGRSTLRTEIARGAPRTLRVPIVPEAHTVTVSIEARVEGNLVEWRGALPVVPGALSVTREGDELVVRSPVPRQTAFLSVVTKTRRLAGSIVSLEDTAEGVVGRVPLLVRETPAWAVVTSEFDDRSSGLVGWPLSVDPSRKPPEPEPTFDVQSTLLLDGVAEVRAQRELEIERIRRAAAVYCASVGVLSALLVFWRLGRNSVRDPSTRFAERDVSMGPRLLAASSVLLGFSLLGIFVLWKV
jgi:hypothetical protein